MPADLGRTAVVIGNFDGVHLGHQHVVARAREIADADGLTLVAVTFDPHPMAVLRPEHAPSPLTTIEDRTRLLGEAGVDAVFALPFDREIAGWSPEEFVDRVLVDALHAAAVVVGANFRFGHRAAGDVATLREAGERRGFVAEGIALDGGPQVWSSTYVRTCLATGDVAGAAEALGRPFTVRGTWSPRATSAARSSASRPPTCPPPASPRPLPTVSTPGGCGGSTPAKRSRRRSASAPTRPSTATARAGSRATCSTGPTWSCTASRWRSSSWIGSAAWTAFESVDKLVAQMHDDVEQARERARCSGEDPA